MPLEVESFDQLRDYVDKMSAAQVVYSRNGADFKIVTTKFYWIVTAPKAAELETWLGLRGAIKVKRWRDIEEIFAA